MLCRVPQARHCWHFLQPVLCQRVCRRPFEDGQPQECAGLRGLLACFDGHGHGHGGDLFARGYQGRAMVPWGPFVDRIPLLARRGATQVLGHPG